jgi:flagellar basal-body rod modification protein FlgD
MAIVGLESATSSTRNLPESPTRILGKDDFLHLLISQLQHQDPLNPADSTEFTAQLAQFSSLEQLNNINDNLENLELLYTSINNSQAVSFIGKEITAYGNSVQLTDSQPAVCNFELEAKANLAIISIYDAAGGFVKTLETGPLSAGRQTVAWDGTDENGNRVPDGTYMFEVQAADVNNQGVNAIPLMSALVTGVSFKNKMTSLITELQTIAIGDVTDVSGGNGQPSEIADEETGTNLQLNGGI